MVQNIESKGDITRKEYSRGDTIGKTKKKWGNAGHMKEMLSKRPADWAQTRLYRHFQNKGHTPSDIRVQPVEHTEDRRRECLDQPYGLNIP